MKRRIFRFSIFSAMIFSVSASASPSFGTRTCINEGWKFRLDSVADYSSPSADDRSWRILDLPHDWSIEGTASPHYASCTGYLPGGVGWYRRTIDIPVSGKDRKYYLYFEGVYNNGEVWINGQRLGIRPNGYAAFMYDITPHVHFGGANTVAVRVDHSKSADSRWYTGSGIYRDVWLVSADPVHIDLWGVFVSSPRVQKDKAEVAVETAVVNETASPVTVTVEHKLFRKNEKTVVASVKGNIAVAARGKSDSRLVMEVGSPKLWSVDDPNLYRVETTVSQNGKLKDRTETVTGIREARFDPDKGFTLNGKNLKLKGVCLHHDAGSLGSAVPRRVWERRLQTLREIGCNAVRMSHNPQVKYLYDLCDEMGFLVMDEAFDEWEFPKRKWLEGWNVGKNPGLQGSAEYFVEWSERDLLDMVRKNRNHPSIVMWSIGNEVDYPNDPYSHPILDREGINQKTIPGYKPQNPHAERYGKIAVRFAALVRKLDPTRAVTGALAGVVMSNQTDYPGALDVVGYNYTEARYAMDHAAYPQRVIYGSENRHEYRNWIAVRDNDYICGQFLWTGIDYLGEAMRWPSRGFGSGLVDLAGFKKTKAMYRQSLWSDQPMVYIATVKKENLTGKTELYDNVPKWNYPNAKDDIRVVVFTNCEDVALYLNGKPVIAEPQRDEVTNARYWDIPYAEGELKAVGLNGGKPCAEHALRTYGAASEIRLSSDRGTLDGKNDLAHVEIELFDANGVPALDAKNDLTVSVSGGGRLLAIENAAPSHMDAPRADTARPYRGKLLAYVVATQDSGDIQVSVSGGGLETSALTFKIK